MLNMSLLFTSVEYLLFCINDGYLLKMFMLACMIIALRIPSSFLANVEYLYYNIIPSFDFCIKS